jgi:hypothetical protein
MQAQATDIQHTYSRRRPEHTPCYQIVLAALNTFIENREGEGRPLPAYVINEFNAIDCGLALKIRIIPISIPWSDSLTRVARALFRGRQEIQIFDVVGGESVLRVMAYGQ